jgi:hypothetical protein
MQREWNCACRSEQEIGRRKKHRESALKFSRPLAVSFIQGFLPAQRLHRILGAEGAEYIHSAEPFEDSRSFGQQIADDRSTFRPLHTPTAPHRIVGP